MLLAVPLSSAQDTPPRPARAESPPKPEMPTLAVVGLANEVSSDEWEDLRIGMGLRAILSQELFETGHFELLEEKAEIREQLRALSRGLWEEGLRQDGAETRLLAGVGALQPDYVAYGKVVYFGRPRSRANIGPVRRNRQTIEIGLELTMLEVASGRRTIAEARGKAQTVATSAFFVYQEDRVELDESAVGTATRKAMSQAVEELMEKLDL